MKSAIKYSTTIAAFCLMICGQPLHAEEKSTAINAATMAQIEQHEGPHLVYEQGKTRLITALSKQGKMTLKVEPISTPKQITVYKPGQPRVSFTVPIKSKITTPPVTYPKPQKLFAISDVEGNFNTVTGILKQHKVIDDKLNWSFGKGHFVIIGDVFDRGNHVTELLWLIYRLETQAQNSGGNVHMLIGNHEMMNLQNDLRYVEPKYLTFETLLKKQTGLSYVDLFRANTELGKWLRSKNIVERIGDTLFTHGGMSPLMAERKLSLETINQTLRAGIDTVKADRSELQKLLFGRNGPMWYRGYFMALKNSPEIEKQQLTNVLNYYGASRIAVGHTIVDKPQALFDGQVIAVDVKHPADHLVSEPARSSYGVLFDGGKVFVVDGGGGVKKI